MGSQSMLKAIANGKWRPPRRNLRLLFRRERFRLMPSRELYLAFTIGNRPDHFSSRPKQLKLDGNRLFEGTKPDPTPNEREVEKVRPNKYPMRYLYLDASYDIRRGATADRNGHPRDQKEEGKLPIRIC